MGGGEGVLESDDATGAGVWIGEAGEPQEGGDMRLVGGAG